MILADQHRLDATRAKLDALPAVESDPAVDHPGLLASSRRPDL
jgi:hypothetical protein